MAKMKTKPMKIGDLEIQVNSNPVGVSFCKNKTCENVVKETEYLPQNGLCLDCFTGIKFQDASFNPEEKTSACNDCKIPITASQNVYNKGFCYDCHKKYYDKLNLELGGDSLPF